MAHNILTDLKFVQLQAYTAASSAVVKTTGVDMSNFDSIVFSLAISSGSTSHTMKLQACATQSTAATDGYVDLEGTGITPSTSAEKRFLMECSNPPYRYVRLYFAPDTTEVVEGIWSIRRAQSLPVTNTVASSQVAEINPDVSSGTA